MSQTEPTIQQLFDLTGKVALITGATGWLGSAMARGLAEAGATVVAASRDAGRAREAAGQLPSPGGASHHGVKLNHMDEVSISDGFAGACEAAGSVDVVVNNGHEQLGGDDLHTINAEQFSRQLENGVGYFLLSRLLRDHVVQRNAPGSVVIISSMYGLVASYPDAYEGVCAANPVAYQVIKAGLNQMVRHLAVYWARDNVRVNALSPGPFPAAHIPEELKRRLCTKSPLARMGRPEELKGGIVYLASDASSYVTGQNLVVDGGWVAW